ALALETMEECIRKDLEDDRKDAECELSRYEDARLMHEAAERTMHSPFVAYTSKKNTFPLLFRVAMDVLPAQA
ncbi:hypothetical protein M405DRAFT_806036, partial [Rhizopogon salebrosus TDB-379]